MVVLYFVMTLYNESYHNFMILFLLSVLLLPLSPPSITSQAGCRQS